MKKKIEEATESVAQTKPNDMIFRDSHPATGKTV
jgi:hypothetical protein